jgi:hypothetical protein
MGRGYLWPQLKVDLLLFTFLAFVAQFRKCSTISRCLSLSLPLGES